LIKVTQNINTIAGSFSLGFSGDGGLATEALLNTAYHSTFDSQNNLYIIDGNNNRIRIVYASQSTIGTWSIIDTYAGHRKSIDFSVT
jgi:hypothetical protein